MTLKLSNKYNKTFYYLKHAGSKKQEKAASWAQQPTYS